MGYQYISPRSPQKSLFHVSIVEGRINPARREEAVANKNEEEIKSYDQDLKKQVKLEMDPDLKDEVFYLDGHHLHSAGLDVGQYITNDVWQDRENLLSFLEAFFETLDPHAASFFKKILSEDSPFLFVHNNLVLDNSKKRTVYFDDQDSLTVVFHPEADTIKDDLELPYINVKRIVNVDE